MDEKEKTFEFKVTFYSTYGTFNETAEDIDKAYENAWATIQRAIKDLPVEVEFDIDCVNEDEDEENDEDNNGECCETCDNWVLDESISNCGVCMRYSGVTKKDDYCYHWHRDWQKGDD